MFVTKHVVATCLTLKCNIYLMQTNVYCVFLGVSCSCRHDLLYQIAALVVVVGMIYYTK
jgi:hypothetical protein